MWPFSKKDKNLAETLPETPAEPELRIAGKAVREHGPYDSSQITIEELDPSDIADSFLDLGCLRIPLPREAKMELGVGPDGRPQEVAMVTPVGRLTLLAFAAPTTTSYWRTLVSQIREGLQRDNIDTRILDGEFGREILGTVPGGTARFIGVDGPRWMIRATVLAPTGLEDEALALMSTVLKNTIVYRGEAAMPVGRALPIVLPEELEAQLRQQVAQAGFQRPQNLPQR